MVDFFQKYGFHLQGREVTQVYLNEANRTGKSMVYLDNAYVLALIQYGIVIFTLLLLLFVLLARDNAKRSDYALALLIVIVAVYGITEVFVFRATRDFLILAIGAMIAGARDDEGSPPIEEEDATSS